MRRCSKMTANGGLTLANGSIISVPNWGREHDQGSCREAFRHTHLDVKALLWWPSRNGYAC